MFEITKTDQQAFHLLQQNRKAYPDGVYDFTYEHRYYIYHYRRKDRFCYIALDRTTGYGSEVITAKFPFEEDHFRLLVPYILFSIKYTGDRRYAGLEQIPRANWIDLIFRCLLPEAGFSIREDQISMSNTMYQGLLLRNVTLYEAEVGTGKTMAYLVAGLIAKLTNQGCRRAGNPITISTSSIELQKNIIEKEIPLLSDNLLRHGMIPRPLRAVLRKGKEHYFCPRRYDDYIRSIQHQPDQHSQVLELLQSLNLPSKGFDLDRLQLPTFIKAKICVKCSCHHCPHQESCRYARFMKSVNRKGAYDFQVTNHNLLLASRKNRQAEGKGILMDSDFVIFDEAHKLAEAANSIFGYEFTPATISGYLNSVKYQGGRKTKKREVYAKLLRKAEDLNSDMFRILSDQYRESDSESANTAISLTPELRNVITGLMRTLGIIIGWRDSNANCGGSASLIDGLDKFLHPGENLCWLALDKSTGAITMSSVPKTMDEDLNRYLWTDPNTHWVLTSGTMRDDTGFSFFKNELGISKYLSPHAIRESGCDSPFDYQNHARLYISENTPFPNPDDPDYIRAVAEEVVKLVKATHGHTAILFTSYRLLHAVYEEVKDQIREYPLIQMNRSNKNAIDQFKRSKNGVLFASGSMWEGVDCAGDILSSVIIVRLPFPLRSQSMEYKRSKCASTGEFIQTYAVPQMIIKLRQGAGRLIRTETDTGILAILDARAAKDGAYRDRVLAALRKYPLVSSIQEIAAFMESVKDDTYTKEASV